MGTGSDSNRFTLALDALSKLAVERSLPIAIVGGLAAIRDGYPAVTDDIDVAIAKSQLGELLEVAPSHGFRVARKAASGWHTLTYNDVEINIVPEGGKAKNLSPTTIPNPSEMGASEGLGYANLASWMELKISSGPQKDQAHVVEVLKQRRAEEIEAIRQHLPTVHHTYLARFEKLAELSDEEKQQESERR